MRKVDPAKQNNANMIHVKIIPYRLSLAEEKMIF